jgi:glycine cleavage system H protein
VPPRGQRPCRNCDTPPITKYARSTSEAGVVFVGITDYAQGELGDVVFVNLPKPGDALTAHQVFGTIEAVKAVADSVRAARRQRWSRSTARSTVIPPSSIATLRRWRMVSQARLNPADLDSLLAPTRIARTSADDGHRFRIAASRPRRR